MCGVVDMSIVGVDMTFKIVAVGKIKEEYYRDAVAEYVKRISRFAEVKIAEVAEKTFNGMPNAAEKEKILAAEGEGILQRAEGCVIALDIDGKEMSSTELSEQLEKLEKNHSTISFVIGGSYGLSQQVKQRAELRLSFGKITLPHQLCRVVLCEQLYRACTIRRNVPYHK